MKEIKTKINWQGKQRLMEGKSIKLKVGSLKTYKINKPLSQVHQEKKIIRITNTNYDKGDINQHRTYGH